MKKCSWYVCCKSLVHKREKLGCSSRKQEKKSAPYDDIALDIIVTPCVHTCTDRVKQLVCVSVSAPVSAPVSSKGSHFLLPVEAFATSLAQDLRLTKSCPIVHLDHLICSNSKDKMVAAYYVVSLIF